MSPLGAAAVAVGGRLAELPSPTQGVWYLGPFPLRAYAVCIIVGIVVAVRMGERRYVARGGRPGVVLDVAAWAVPFGIVGGRLYHVATSWQPYFGPDGDPVKALYVWEGGLGIWGAIALGALGAFIAARRHGLRMPPLADALAPGVLAAQAIGRWGNWFNNELYGRSTDLPWGLRIHEWDLPAGKAVTDPGTGDPLVAQGSPFHPTFLYESLWSAAGVVLLLWADRRFRLGHGRVFALYVAVYCSGRLWIEALRIDEANTILGLRVNIWVAGIVLLVAVVVFAVLSWRRPGRDGAVLRDPVEPPAATTTDVEAGNVETDDAASDQEVDTRPGEPVGPSKDQAVEDAGTEPLPGDAGAAPAEGPSSRSATT